LTSPHLNLSPLIPPYEGGRQIGTELPLYGLHGHSLPFVKGELEWDFGGGKRRGKAHGISRRRCEGGLGENR
jgi:hypothetical protein